MDFILLAFWIIALPGATPTQGAHAESERERGLAPGPGRRSARPPKGAGRLRERRKGKKREITVRRWLLAVCKRKYEGAELRYGRPKPAAANANSLAHEAGTQSRRSMWLCASQAALLLIHG